MSKIPKEEDPFWEPPEDVLIGTASVFLQSLSYALDFDDKLSITDYKVFRVVWFVLCMNVVLEGAVQSHDRVEHCE